MLAINPQQTAAHSTATAPDYTLWGQVLETYVNEQGKVNYEGLLKNRGRFDRFIKNIKHTDINGLSPVEQKAFWINAYNAITMKVILDNYPVKDIRFVNFSLVWKLKRKVAQGKYSLGHIEHEILRPLGDPRIHFAINCASGGCPKLSRKPFYPETLEQQLDFEAKRFINDHSKVRIDRNKNILFHSAILDWFKEDFLVVSPDILDYIKKYINQDDLSYLEKNSVKIKVLDYDWSLNKQ